MSTMLRDDSRRPGRYIRAGYLYIISFVSHVWTDILAFGLCYIVCASSEH